MFLFSNFHVIFSLFNVIIYFNRHRWFYFLIETKFRLLTSLCILNVNRCFFFHLKIRIWTSQFILVVKTWFFFLILTSKCSLFLMFLIKKKSKNFLMTPNKGCNFYFDVKFCCIIILY